MCWAVSAKGGHLDESKVHFCLYAESVIFFFNINSSFVLFFFHIFIKIDFKNGGFQTFDYKCRSTFYSNCPLFFSVSQQNAIVLKFAELSTMNASTPSLISQSISAWSLRVLATQLGTVILNKYIFVLACRVQTAHQNGALKDVGLFPWCRGWSLKLPSQLLLMLWPTPRPIRMPPSQCQLKLETKKVRQHQLAFNMSVLQRITVWFSSPAVVVCYSFTSTTCTSTNVSATGATAVGVTVKSPRPPSPSSNVVVLPSGSTVYVKSEFDCHPETNAIL